MTTKNNTKAAAAEEVKTEIKASAPVEKKQVQKTNLVYLGPTITGVVRHSTVFDGVLPEKVQKCVSEFPMMRRLFVEADNMTDAVKELRKEQSALSAIYEQTAKKYTKGGK